MPVPATVVVGAAWWYGLLYTTSQARCDVPFAGSDLRVLYEILPFGSHVSSSVVFSLPVQVLVHIIVGAVFPAPILVDARLATASVALCS